MSGLLASLFNSWDMVFPYSLSQNPNLKYYWLTLPKMIVWKLWLERNAHIFRDSSASVSQVVGKIQVLLGECI
jgi:hypothetical protein